MKKRPHKSTFANSQVKVSFVETKFDSDQNPLFSKVKINFLYKGMNRNGSKISKRTAEKIGSKIAYIPIVGEFLKEKEDFGTHGGKLTITSDDIIYEETTVPYGVVGSAENLWWEEVENEEGKMVEYLTTWGYLWTKRYPDAKKVLTDNNWQSMELDRDSIEGRWIQKGDGEDFYFNIDDALISAFCILGEDIEPAFEDSQVQSFSLAEKAIKDNNFKEEFEAMKVDFVKYVLALGEEDKIITDNFNNDLEGGTDSMLYKFNIENPSSVFSSLNGEEIVGKVIVVETAETVIYFDLEDQKFYTRKFTIDEENVIVWAEDAEVIEYTVPTDTTMLEATIMNLELDATEFVATIETKDETIGTLTVGNTALQETVDSYSVIQAEKELIAKKEVIDEFREKLSEEAIKLVEDEIDKFSVEEIKSKLALALYELSKGDNGDGAENNFTYNGLNTPKGSNLPSWAKTVIETQKK